MNKPTSEAWFGYWKKYLEKNNVTFVRGELKKLNFKSTKIVSCELTDNKVVMADEYCLAINPNDSPNIFKESGMLDYQNIFDDLKTINNQISFFITFKKLIKFPEDMNAIVLIDSPLNITMYSQDNIWCKNFLDKDKIKSLWSGTCCQAEISIQLQPEDLKKEILKQIFDCKMFLEIIHNENNFKITMEDIQKVEIYDEWKYIDGRLQAVNKKWVNTMYNDSYKPSNKTSYDNLYIAGGHTKTTFPIWSMESSTESGKIVSNLILSKYNLKRTYIYKHDINRFYKCLGYIDNLFYYIGLPHILICIYMLLILLIIGFIIYKIIRKKLDNASIS